MSHSSPVRALVDVACAALVLGASLGCSGHSTVPARAPAASPDAESSRTEPAQSGTLPPEGTPVREESSPEADETADTVVTLIAKPGLWPLDVEAAHRVLQAFGPVNREQRSTSALSLVGGPYGALDRFDIAYSLDDQHYWVFGSAGFFLDHRDPTRLYHTLQARLTQLLGKPAPTERDKSATEDAAPPPVVWDLGEAWLSLAHSTDHGEDVVLIAIRQNERYSD